MSYCPMSPLWETTSCSLNVENNPKEQNQSEVSLHCPQGQNGRDPETFHPTGTYELTKQML